jgi:hypothetical protein
LNIEQAIFKYLSTYAGLSALVSTRIYPDLLPQTITYPAIVYTLISGVNDETLGEDSDTTEERWQFTINASSVDSRANVCKQLKKAFKDYNKGSTRIMGGSGGVPVGSVNHAGQTNFYEEETKIYQRTVDFMFIYDEN